MRRRSFIGNNPFVAGWRTTLASDKQSPALMYVQVRVITNRKCQEKYQNIGEFQSEAQFRSGVMCSEQSFDSADSCQSDTGGPLMLPVRENGREKRLSFYQIGIVSYNVGCAPGILTNVPGIFTNVKHYAEWIQKQLT